MFTLVLKTIFRGGYKPLHIVFLIAIFTAIPIATGLLFSGYIANISSRTGILQPSFYYGFEEVNESVEVLFSTISLNNTSIVILSVDNINLWIDLHRIRVNEVGDGDIYVGSKIASISDSILEYLGLDDEAYIGGILHGDGYIEYSIVVPGYIAKKLGLEWSVVYEGREENLIPVPSMIWLPSVAASEFSNTIFVLSILLYIILSVSIPAVLSLSIYSSSDIRRLFKLVYRESITSLVKLTIYLSLIIFISGFALGLSVAFIFVHLSTFIFNRVFGLPYIRPDIFTGFIELTSSLFLIGILSTLISAFYLGTGVSASD